MRKTNEDVLKVILEQSLAGYWDWDIPSGDEYLSPTFKKMFGYEDHEIANRADSWQKMIFQEDLPGVFEKFNQHVESKGEIPFYIEVRYHHKNGSTVWVICTGKVIEWDENDKPIRMVGCHVDITEQKKAEEILRKSEEKFRVLAENSKDMIYRMSIPDGKYEYASPSSTEVFGYSPDVFINSPHLIQEVIHPDWKDYFREKWKMLLDGDVPDTYEYQIIHGKTGKVRWLNQRNVLIVNDEGQLIAIEGIVTDITERKAIEDALRKSEELFRKMFKYHTAVMLLINPKNGMIKDANKAAEEFYGYSHQQLCNLKIQDINQLSDSEVEEEYKNALTGCKNCFVFPHILMNGQIRKVEVHSTPLEINNETLLFSIIHDITDRVKAEQTLVESEKKFRSYIENAPYGVFIVDEKGNYFEVNKEAQKITGYSKDELLKMNIIDLIQVEDHKKAEDHFKTLVETGKSVGDLSYIKKDGNLGFWTVEATKLSDNRFLGFATDITERKHSEKKLKASEKKYSSLFNTMLEGFALHEIICDEDGKPVDYRFLDLNPAFEKLTGINRDDAIGKTVLEILPDTEPEWIEKYGKVALVGTSIRFESYSCALNRYYHVVAFRPNPNQFAVIFSDITERKQVEDALLESERKNIAWIENSPVCTKVIDLDFNLQFMSKSGVQAHKIDDITEYYGKPYPFDFYPDSSKIPMRNNLEKVKETRETITQEAYVNDTNGKKLWFHSTIVPVNDNNGKLDYLLVVSLNITKRKQADAEKDEEKKRLEITLRSIGDGVITTDIKGNIVIMNKVAEELCGWKQDEALGKPLSSVFNIINDNTREPHENPVEKVLSNGEIIELAYHTLLISRDGTERAIANSGAPINDNEGKTIGVVLVFRDMTEKNQLNSTIQRTQKLESLGVLAGGIAHDFNNLMGGILGYIDMAREESNQEIVTTYLSKALNSIDRARALTGQLLTFAKGGAPIQQISNLFPFLKETVQFVLSGANVSCSFDIPQDLWSCNFDKNQIGQVFDNIIINAQQAMPIGGKIELRAHNTSFSEREHPTLTKGDYVKISVKDTGVGIQSNLVNSIFDPFFTTKAKGHGLGLATCYSIIKRHGGHIDVESEQGKGTSFHVYLPATQKITSSESLKTTETHKGTGTILVMDDEEVMRETIKSMLKLFGYTVVCTENGEKAVEFYETESKANRKIAGMIFDLTVPGGMGGKAAIEEIRRSNTDIPAFVASGYADDPVMKNPEKFGFIASICKPFTKAELSEMLNNYMVVSE